MLFRMMTVIPGGQIFRLLCRAFQEYGRKGAPRVTARTFSIRIVPTGASVPPNTPPA